MKKRKSRKNDADATEIASCQSGDESMPCCSILESMTDGVFTVDLKRRINTFFNRAAEEITGFAFQEAVNQYCFDILRSSTCQTNCPLEKTLTTGEPVYNHPAVIINRSGKEIPVSVTTALIRNKLGDVVGAVEIFRDLSVIETLRKAVAGCYNQGDMISKNQRMQEIFDILPDVAESDSTLLIQGPSGSGKGLLARVVHDLSTRKDKPFIKVNCGAIPETLLESELFGYVRGAFTDAKKDKPGRFSLADGGTLFLDEIGDTSPSLQVKLLRALEEKTFIPLGGVEPVKVDVRIMAATHRDITAMLRDGLFREDLYYRLNIIKIEIPPLCERKEDIPLLAENIIARLNALKGRQIVGVSADVMARLMNYSFPGNIRELENILEHACVLCRGALIEEKHLPYDFMEKTGGSVQPGQKAGNALTSSETRIIREVLERHRGNRTAAAQELGLSRTTLWRKIRQLRIE
ncbi:MAG: sigma 54-interacting transcriptional regulator [Deltaproteobacteria bacterium]|nr:sigma 54-interacting transcriptional regulator [Deltaproteobacteria bacterium]